MVIGWDIGGVNTKVARVDGGRVLAVRGRPFELQRAPGELTSLLRGLARDVGVEPDDRHAVTMTAELSQMFRTKREGVACVLDAVDAAFPESPVHVFTVRGEFLSPVDARRDPLAVAAANWAATAHVVGRHHADALLVDVGTTTTDIIPISGGVVVARGHADPERLASGELVYTGALRTPVEAIATHVPFRGAPAGVSAEGFALAGDVHLWRGDLAASDYSVAAPDGRPATREFAGERLARTICADRDLVDEAGITAIANALADAQVARIAAAVRQVAGRHPHIREAVVTGLGAFLGRGAAMAAGLDVVPLADELGADAARCAPAVCVALLLEGTQFRDVGRGFTPRHDLLVIKLGGSLLAHPEQLDAALATIGDMARRRALVIVPGGGPFADVVRDVDERIGLPDDAAHWMAVLAMDQYAHLIAGRLAGGLVVANPGEIRSSLANQRVPVLAPSRWLKESDPLPHTWDVTSDSIGAWIAGQLAAQELWLVKPPGASGPSAVDPYFATACPPDLKVSIIPIGNLRQIHPAPAFTHQRP